MGEVTGTIPFYDDEGNPQGMLSFGNWLLHTIRKNADDYKWVCRGDDDDLFLWDKALEVPGKNAAHFLDKEHLHLINKVTDVAISTKHPKAEVTDSQGLSKKRTRGDKVPEHRTGLQAVQSGDSPEISFCNKNAPPEGVIDWQVELIKQLRALTKDWLREDATKDQLQEFLA